MNTEFLILALIALIIGIVPLFLVKRDLKILLIAGGAYFSAIITKEIVQVSFLHFFQTPQIQTYLAYGILTAVTEPGFAYLFVRFVKQNPQTYGVSLAFWENGFLVGLLGIVSAIALPANYNLTLISPLLNEPLAVVITGRIMDRLSSLFLHYAWGVSAYLSFWKKDAKFILTIAPLGFIDSLTAYVDLSHINSYFALAVPAFIAGIIGFLLAKYYLKKA
ncbi:hypothetical protein [Acidianus sp. HS-5]|uniref:hypothetical protein n=1 Tax=Acidianus sp. HS-5 TaxID=2886040 RepID=UPI001F38DA76|nr:hypothetical protein [Acidianus sp. HS-5]BDC19487.1 hypothetical protein HS5_23770 [Acidianus sp. HS-5]